MLSTAVDARTRANLTQLMPGDAVLLYVSAGSTIPVSDAVLQLYWRGRDSCTDGPMCWLVTGRARRTVS